MPDDLARIKRHCPEYTIAQHEKWQRENRAAYGLLYALADTRAKLEEIKAEERLRAVEILGQYYARHKHFPLGMCRDLADLINPAGSRETLKETEVSGDE